MHLHQVYQKSQGFRLWDPETRSVFTSRDVVFDEESMLQEKLEIATDRLADTQEKRVEFSKSPKRPDVIEEDSSDLDGDEQKATKEQPRPLRRSVGVTVPLIRYGWEDDHVSFALVTEHGISVVTGKRSRQMITSSGLQHGAGDGVFG